MIRIGHKKMAKRALLYFRYGIVAKKIYGTCKVDLFQKRQQSQYKRYSTSI